MCPIIIEGDAFLASPEAQATPPGILISQQSQLKARNMLDTEHEGSAWRGKA